MFFSAARTCCSSLVFAGPLAFFAVGAGSSASWWPKKVITGSRMRKGAQDGRSWQLAVGRSRWMHTTHTFSEPTVRLGHRGVREGGGRRVGHEVAEEDRRRGHDGPVGLGLGVCGCEGGTGSHAGTTGSEHHMADICTTN